MPSMLLKVNPFRILRQIDKNLKKQNVCFNIASLAYSTWYLFILKSADTSILFILKIFFYIQTFYFNLSIIDVNCAKRSKRTGLCDRHSEVETDLAILLITSQTIRFVSLLLGVPEKMLMRIRACINSTYYNIFMSFYITSFQPLTITVH